MYHFFVIDLSLWEAVLLFLAGIPLLAVALQAAIRKVLPPDRSKAQNDVAGFLVAVIGVVYAVTIGFSIDDQWDNFTEVRKGVFEEAFVAGSVARGSTVMGAAGRRDVTEAVVSFDRAVVASWPTKLDQSREQPSEEQALRHVFDTVGDLRPASEAQEAYVDGAMQQLLQVSVLNTDRHNDARTAHLAGPMWIAVILTSAVALFFSLMFGMDSPWLHYGMIAGVAMVIGVNLFLVVLLEYPLVGALSVDSSSFQAMAHDLLRGLSQNLPR